MEQWSFRTCNRTASYFLYTHKYIFSRGFNDPDPDPLVESLDPTNGRTITHCRNDNRLKITEYRLILLGISKVDTKVVSLSADPIGASQTKSGNQTEYVVAPWRYVVIWEHKAPTPNIL